MHSLEGALRKLAVKMTGKKYRQVPRSSERIISFIADHLADYSSVSGEKGEDGKSIVSVTFVKSAAGEILGGTWTDSENKEHEIIINIKEDEV